MSTVLLFLAVVAMATLSASVSTPTLPKYGCFGKACVKKQGTLSAINYKPMFEEFKSRFHKRYESKKEEFTRFMIFITNMKKAKQLAQANPEATFGATPFADLTEAEFEAYHSGAEYYADRQKEIRTTTSGTAYAPKLSAEELHNTPPQVDWRPKGAVTAVKNQGQCGSCWSFSTTGGIEGQWFLAGNPLTSLSEQFFVSCDTIDQGCNGGLMNNAYEWVMSTHGGKIPTESSYPYVSGNGVVPSCQPSRGTFGAKIVGHYNIFHSEDQMRGTVAKKGPLSIAVDASAWQFYMGGLMSSCGGSRLDHGVLIVGYSMTGGSYNSPYWIIKNSWGASWGEQGYIYVAYGSDQCLLTHYPTTAIVNGTVPPPPPTPRGGYFSHTVYDNEGCSRGAQTFLWGEGECVSWDGVSFKAQCQSGSLAITAYPKSTNCTGDTAAVSEPLDKCTQDSGDFCFYKNTCHSGQRAATTHRRTSTRAHDHFFSSLKRSI